MTDNVVSFPKSKIIRDGDQNLEEIAKLKTKSLQSFGDSMTDDMAQILFECLRDNGLDVQDESFTKDFAFLVSMLNAIVYRSLEIEHPFHKFIDENVAFNIEAAENDLDTLN